MSHRFENRYELRSSNQMKGVTQVFIIIANDGDADVVLTP